MAELNLTAPPAEIERKVLALKPTLFINCGAYTAVDKAEGEIGLSLQINALAVGAIANACRKTNSKLIQISTDYVLADELSAKPKTEQSQEGPESIYGYSKLLGEKAAQLAPLSTIVRTSWVFGDGANFVKTMLNLAKTYPEVSVVSDQVGRPTYALDLARAIYELIQKTEVLPPLINIQNSGRPVSWADFAKRIFELVNLKTKVKPITTAEYLVGKSNIAARPHYSIFDLTELEKLGVKTRSWEDALKDYLATLGADGLV